ncbi:uncharacterized protein K02A2.6-like [Mercenaria mercenaria]|uniref:uncharacterized protein K02A2.6-like n=1 Tax=Mercenaria mercenaria TaxID=6596 RepID=UPI00234E6EA1|nr:uncharacterized protein K02A2.6-like [Mercenaria mercenaria]
MATRRLDLPTPKPFKVLGQNTNLSSTWDNYMKRFEYYLSASGITKDEQKKALLLHLGGEEIQDIYETMTCDRTTYQNTVDALTRYFNPKKNIAYERHIFRQASQEQHETIDNFIIRLKKLAVTCDYPDGSANDMIRDQVVEKCRSTELKKKFLRETDLTLDKIQSISRALELADLHATKMEEINNGHRKTENSQAASYMPAQDESTYKISKAPYHHYQHQHQQQQKKTRKQYQPRARPTQQPSKFKTCYRCGGTGHSGHECMKSRNIVCHKCKKLGHYANMCKSKKVEVRLVDDEFSEDYTFQLNTQNKSPHVNVEIEGIECSLLIDSGSSVNCLDRATYEKIRSGDTKISSAQSKIYPYAQSKPIKTIGVAEFNVKIGGKVVKLKFHIIDRVCTPLLGFKSAVELGLLEFNVSSVIVEENSVKEIISEYEDRFQGLGKLKDFQLKLNINKDIKPVAQPARRIPFKMREQVKQQIKQLLDQDVIEKVEGATPWTSPLLCVPKQNGQIRLCVDMRVANTAIQRERFPLPNIEETLEELNGARYYTKLDLNMGYHQIELDEESREITTFVTNEGLYRYRRLMFGISCAPEIYQRILQQTIQDIPNCKNISDDILIWGDTKAANDKTLRDVLQRLRDKTLTLNKDKCDFCKTSIEFMGHTLTSEGLKPQQSKIQAVLDTEPPQNVKEVKSFLGLVTYCAKFLPNYATVSEPIRKLTRKNIKFEWGREQMESFQELKDLLTSASVMAYYNPNAETTITVDGSPVGLGAILAQKQSDGHFRPVAYASRTLNQTERRYSQIEIEMLACVWGVERFRTYVYGQPFKLLTDHRPLLNIFKPTHKPPARLERLLMRLQCYNFTVEHQPGISNPADILSRSTFNKENCEISNITEKYLDYVCENSVPKAMTLDQIDKESSQDKFTQQLIKCINHDKWPKAEEFKTFFKIRRELSTHNNIILRGNRIVIPQAMRGQVLKIAHESHQGIVKTKQMLREKVYWPGIDSEIEELIRTCEQCQLNSFPPKQPTITPTELPDRPWQTVGMDLTGPFPGGEHILVVIDYYSRFPEAEIIKNTSSRTIINKLMRIFATHGLPETIKTDNAPNMVSAEITEFFRRNGIKHHRVTPYHPQAAGLVENFNKTLGKSLKAAVSSKKNWRIEIYKFLMDYRTTPHVATGAAPATLLFNRTVKNKLPHIEKHKNDITVRQRDNRQKQKMKKYADRRCSKQNVIYKLGQKVLVRNRKFGKLCQNWENNKYTVVGQKGNTLILKSVYNELFRRHISQVRPLYERNNYK